MFASRYLRWAPLVALVALAACAGQQAGPGGALPQAAAPAASRNTVRPNHGKSWMDPLARSNALVYISDTFGHVVNVYTYPRLRYVGQLTAFSAPSGECTDKAGDVWITDMTGFVYKYAHGGTSPIETLSTGMISPRDCAVNNKNGDLAVANSDTQVAIVHTGSSTPTTYNDPNFGSGWTIGMVSLAYDNRANLFVDGNDQSGTFHYAELAKGSTSLADLTLNGFVTSSGAGGVRWDGAYIVVGDSQSTLYRTAGSNVVSTIALTTTCAFADAIVPSRRGSTVIAPDQCSSGSPIDEYAYPAGGSPIRSVTTTLNTPYGAAFSR
ncbi:MAG: hypothetical protein JO263_08575 [Candidatus Eremiobacteraeota bacterium]|nr:hypothetical protein [Candidatus Eremiobacteraeota bacterium]